MKRHTFYPSAIPTVRSRRKQAMRFLRWLLLFLLLMLMLMLMLMALGAAAVIAGLYVTNAQLESVFMQGMKAGSQLCSRGV